MARGQDTGNHANRQVGRERFSNLSPEERYFMRSHLTHLHGAEHAENMMGTPGTTVENMNEGATTLSQGLDPQDRYELRADLTNVHGEEHASSLMGPAGTTEEHKDY